MKNKEFQQLINKYTKNSKDIYNYNNVYINQDTQTNKSPHHIDAGYVNLFIIAGRNYTPLRNATVTVNVRQGLEKEFPIMKLVTSINPILIQLPVAYNPATLIRGPEYYFSTYNIVISADGYYPVKILNIRMFPRISSTFYINMIETKERKYAPKNEDIIFIPPHPRDKMEYNDD